MFLETKTNTLCLKWLFFFWRGIHENKIASLATCYELFEFLEKNLLKSFEEAVPIIMYIRKHS